MSVTTPFRSRLDIPSAEELERIPVIQEPQDTEVILTLKRMRKLLEHNWTKGNMEHAGNYCLAGALQKETYHRVLFKDLDCSSNSLIVIPQIIFWVMPKLVVSLFALHRKRSYRKTLRALKRELGVSTIRGLMIFNDESSHYEVLELIDSAIETEYAKRR